MQGKAVTLDKTERETYIDRQIHRNIHEVFFCLKELQTWPAADENNKLKKDTQKDTWANYPIHIADILDMTYVTSFNWTVLKMYTEWRDRCMNIITMKKTLKMILSTLIDTTTMSTWLHNK